ncbi:class I SAM-dependent methyltransferase [Massilia eurypsychrophila]|uniref:class I SAM-dependent methyltransferase n=1 Tax=Massilia eurypsychrophila TaxID=1485217 RepID=UPI00103334BA|nr:SAM-dependent methyltransferase [Massilia eurypsychrophila]
MKAGSPSNTALIVAAGLQLVRPVAAVAALLPGEAIRRGEALLRGAHPRMAGLLRRAWFRALCLTLERATLRGICLHFALRKRAMRDHAEASIVAGSSQVVVLGAGLDTLCLELQAAYPPLCCIEIDHPATQHVKLRAAGADGRRIHFIGADLAQRSLGEVLAACPAFRRDAPTLFVAEGLLMYMPLAAVAALFAQMAAAAPDSRVAFTWMEPQADGRPNFSRPSRLVDFWLKLRGEPMLSSMPRAGLARFLRDAGFAMEGAHESVELLGQAQRQALGPEGVPIAGEYICFARAAPQANGRGGHAAILRTPVPLF